MLRFALAGVFARWLGHAFLGTALVNITGSFLIAFIATLGPIGLWEQLLMIGLLGGYTAVSSFSLPTLQFIREGRWTVALANAVASVVFCTVWLGHLSGSAFRR